ncbi:MAG: hypothetical protein IJE68_06610 [Clostridia bacterium]|nr:hypothetical protein [Clostridia bacterium]
MWNKNKFYEYIMSNFYEIKEKETIKIDRENYSIENGYYYYKKICRTSDEEKKNNFTDEEATGYEVGIYDIDTDKLYYYWTSF